jgi:predicted phage terminase large subunit-like protein
MMTPEQTTLAAILADESASFNKRVMAGDALRYSLVKENQTWAAHCVAQSVIYLGIDALKCEFDSDIYDSLERAYITRAPNDFHSYLIALEWRRAAASRFYQPRKRVMKSAVDSLTAMMVYDLYDILMLSMPVRVGKSTLGLFFLSWCIGRKPDSPILATGYAEKITKMFHDGLSEVYDDPEYGYHEIFPQIDLVNTSAKDLTLDFRDDGKKATRKYKSVTCRAIDGSLTGATEARQLLYCDDLVRDIEEALSLSRLDILCTKFTTNVRSRKKQGCKELHIGTRWSVHDPMGMVERENEDNPRCKVITLPALDPETDESNFDYPYGVGFSTEFYRDVREHEDDVTWGCVYQQLPREREGLLFPREELKFCMSLPEHPNPPDDIFTFCDVAFGGDDYLSMPVAYQWGDDPPIIADWVFLKGGYKLTEPKVAGTIMHRSIARAVFEANNGGDFYSRDIDKELKKCGYNVFITAVRAPSNKSKETRIIQHSPAIKEFVFLDPTSADASPMYRMAMAQLMTYTQSGKNPNDDAPDSLAGLAAMMRCSLNATLTVYDRKHI